MGGDKKLHVGFPEKVLDKYLSKMVMHGYKVAVIEQTETPKMLEERIKREKPREKKDKCVKRDICQIATKGTFVDRECYEAKYVLSFKRAAGTYRMGVCFFDI